MNTFNPFPHTTILQQTTLNLFCQNIGYPFNYSTMFSKSCLLQRRQKASIWGKGLKDRKVYQMFNVSGLNIAWKLFTNKCIKDMFMSTEKLSFPSPWTDLIRFNHFHVSMLIWDNFFIKNTLQKKNKILYWLGSALP